MFLRGKSLEMVLGGFRVKPVGCKGRGGGFRGGMPPGICHTCRLVKTHYSLKFQSRRSHFHFPPLRGFGNWLNLAI